MRLRRLACLSAQSVQTGPDELAVWCNWPSRFCSTPQRVQQITALTAVPYMASHVQGTDGDLGADRLTGQASSRGPFL